MQTLEQIEWPIKNGQSRDTGHIGYRSHGTKINITKTQQRKLVNLADCLQQYLVQYTYLSLKKIV